MMRTVLFQDFKRKIFQVAAIVRCSLEIDALPTPFCILTILTHFTIN